MLCVRRTLRCSRWRAVARDSARLRDSALTVTAHAGGNGDVAKLSEPWRPAGTLHVAAIASCVCPPAPQPQPVRPQWQPAASCPGLNEGAGVLADEYTHCWSTPLEMSMRNIATPLLWVQVIGFLVQSIGFMLAAVGMRQFAGKYADDWKRLRRFEVWIGTVVKQFPKYARYLNLALLALLGLQIAMFFFVGVCKVRSRPAPMPSPRAAAPHTVAATQ